MMFAVMSDHFRIFDVQFPQAASMSRRNIPEAAFVCDSDFNTSTLTTAASTTSVSNSIMPVLLHNSKRKRLDAVLTKLTLSSCKDEFDTRKYFSTTEEEELALMGKEQHSPRKSANTEPMLDHLDHQHDDTTTTQVPSTVEMRDRTPQKQRSLDTEMSITVGALKLDMGDSNSEDESTRDSHFTANSMEVPSSPKAVQCLLNSGGESAASSPSQAGTPPTSVDCTGGTWTEHEKSERQPDRIVSETTNVTAATTTMVKTTTVVRHAGSDQLAGSPRSSQQQLQLLQQQTKPNSPRANLLSHDSHRKQKVSDENAYVPDAQARSRMLPTVRPVESALSSSPPFCTSLLNSLPCFGLSAEAQSSTVCKCGHCCKLPADQSDSQMPTFFGCYNQQYQAWDNNMKPDSKRLGEALAMLLASNTYAAKQEDVAALTTIQGKLKKDNSQISSSSSLETAELLQSTQSSLTSLVNNNNKKRSHSDSDMTPEYMSLFNTLPVHEDSKQTILKRTESGLLLDKNGRRVPKPLSKAAVVGPEENTTTTTTTTSSSTSSTPQESPLDLSVKSLSPHILSGLSQQYPELLALGESFTTSCSVPSLNNMLLSAKQRRMASLSCKMSPLMNSLLKCSNFNDNHRTPHKRRNISTEASDSSSLSSIPAKPLSAEPIKETKKHSPLFDFYQDDRLHPSNWLTKAEYENCSISPVSSPRQQSHASRENMTVSTSSKPNKSSRSRAKVGSAVKTLSLSSLTDLERVSSSHACHLCGQTFSFYDRLAKHMASRHRNRQQCDSAASKNYLCDVCQRSFARSDMLTRHMRLHTGIKPYTCKICNQVFSRSDHLSTHQRTHTGEKPYKCPQCPYAACRRDMITRHMKTHSRYEVPDSSSNEDLSKSA